MRQAERKQLGLAVAALMLCFTSLVPLTDRKGADATIAEPRPLQTLKEVCQMDATDDRAIQISWLDAANESPLLVVRRNDDVRFDALAQDINSASVADASPRPPVLTMVLYERNGQPDYQLLVTSQGLLYDPKTKQVFQTNENFHEFLKTIPKSTAQAN